MSGAPGSLPGVLRAFISHLHGAWASHPLPRVHNVTTSSICPPCDHAIHDPSTLATVFCSLPVLMPLGGFSSHPTGQWFTGRLQSADQDELIPGYRLSSPSTSRAGPSTNRRSQQCASRFNPTCPEPTQWHNGGYAIWWMRYPQWDSGVTLPRDITDQSNRVAPEIFVSECKSHPSPRIGERAMAFSPAMGVHPKT